MAKFIEGDELDEFHPLGNLEAAPIPEPLPSADEYVADPNYNTEHDKLDPDQQGGV